MQRSGWEAARIQQEDLARSDPAGNLDGHSFCLCHRDHFVHHPRKSPSHAGPERYLQVDEERAGRLRLTDDQVSCVWVASRSEEMRSRHDDMGHGPVAELVDGKDMSADARGENGNRDEKFVGG